MNKIIIHNHAEISEVQALEFVQRVMAYGRISNNQKSFCSTSILTGRGKSKYRVDASLTVTGSDVFIINKNVN